MAVKSNRHAGMDVARSRDSASEIFVFVPQSAGSQAWYVKLSVYRMFIGVASNETRCRVSA